MTVDVGQRPSRGRLRRHPDTAATRPATPAPPRTSAPERLMYLLIALLLAAAVFTSQAGYYTPDIKIEVYLNPWHRLLLDLSTWLPDPQGGFGNYNLGLAPVDAAVALIRTLGASAEVAVRLVKLVLMLLGAWGAVAFLREVAGRRTDAVLRVAVFAFFLANPFAVVGANQLAIQLPMALLPWFLVCVLRALRAGGWGWPAAAALLLFAMSGMNTGVVPVIQLVCLPAVVVWAAWRWRIPARRVVAALARLVVLGLGVSLYWLIPAVLSFGAASTVVDNTETVEAISAVSSFAEVLRGLGMWTMYGSSAVTGPWQPGFEPYLTNPFVIIASFAFPALALAGLAMRRHAVTVLAFAMAASAAVVMVGQYPVEDRSPFGRLIEVVFSEVPGAIALRTTNKAGPGLALGLSVLCAYAVAAVAPRLRTLGQRALGLTALGVVLALMAQPIVVGQMYTGRWRIPAYWDTVGQRLEAGGVDSRVWWVPGQVLARYRWSTDSEDDLPFSVLDQRSSMLRTTRPTGSAQLSNLLAALDGAMQQTSTYPATVSSAARYLGVGTVFLRSDVDWQAFQGGRPIFLQTVLDGDPGLRTTAVLGRPGENVRPDDPNIDDTVARAESGNAPLHFYDLVAPGTLARAEDAGASVLVAGDGYSFANLQLLGYLTGDRPFRYLADLDPAAFADSLGAGHALVITDSNRRRDINQTTLTDALGPLLPATGALTRSRTLWPDDAGAQTVLTWDGVRDVVATVPGTTTPTGVEAGVVRAFDGSPGTMWVAGDLGTSAVGTTVRVDLRAPTRLTRVTVDTLFNGVGASAFTVSAGGTEVEAEVAPDGRATADLGGVVADSVSIRVAQVLPNAVFDNPPVRIRTIDIAGVRAIPVTRTPTTLSHLVASLPADRREALDATPLGIVLTRDLMGPFPDDDHERTLVRDVEVPVARTLSVVGIARTRTSPRAGVCQPVARIDGQVLAGRPVFGTPASLPAGEPWLFTGCRDVTPGVGTMRVRAVAGAVLDQIALQDDRLLGRPAPVPAQPAQILERTSTETLAQFPVGTPGRLAVISQSWGPGWSATLDGEPVTPVPVDGHAIGIALPTGGQHVVRVRYQPQDAAVAARGASAVALAACLVLLLALVPWWQRRRRTPRPAPRIDRGAARVPAGLRRRAGALALVVAACWFFAGPVPAVVVAAAAGLWAWGGWSSRSLAWCAAGVMAAVPFVWMVAIIDLWGLVSSALVSAHPLPGQLAAVALGLALLAVVRWRTGPAPQADPGPMP